MERNRTVDGAISKRRRPPINRVLLVHEPAALADLRPATVNQCFYEHSLASTASLQPRTNPATHSASPLSCIRPDTHRSSSLFALASTDSHPFATRLLAVFRHRLSTIRRFQVPPIYSRSEIGRSAQRRFVPVVRIHATRITQGLSRWKKGNSRSPRKRGCLDNLLSLRINIRFAVH